MGKKQGVYRQKALSAARRVWVVEECRLCAEEPVQETFGYNDWDIYHGA